MVPTMRDEYEADCANAGVEAFGDSDWVWLELGDALRSAAGEACPDGYSTIAAACRRIHARLSCSTLADGIERVVACQEMIAPTDFRDALSHAAIVVSSDAEAAGAFAVAMRILDLARMCIARESPRHEGRMLACQARIMRKLSDLVVAGELYDQVAHLARATGDTELQLLVAIGNGAIAGAEHDRRLAIHHFRTALAIAGTTPEFRAFRAAASRGLSLAAKAVAPATLWADI